MDNYEMQEEMEQSNPPKNEHRIGYFFLSFTPLIFCLLGQVAAAFVFMLAALLIFTIQAGHFDFGFIQKSINVMLYSIVAYHIIGVIVGYFWMRYVNRKEQKRSFKELAGKLKWTGFLGLILSGIALCIFSNATVFIEVNTVPVIVEKYAAMTEGMNLDTDIFMIMAVVLLAPIGEELLFRGLTLRYAEKSFHSFVLANCFQALMFAIAHLNWVQGIYAFFIGLFLGCLVRETKSLLPAMFVHFVVNFSSTFWISYVFIAIYGEEYPGIAGSVLWLAGSVAAVIAIFCLLLKNKGKVISNKGE